MKNNKQKIVLVSMEGDKVFMAHRTPQTQIKVDVTAIFNFGMFIQRTLENPNDEETQKYIDENFYK